MLASRIHPDDLEFIGESLRHSRETLTIWQCEYRVCLPDGTLKWVFAHAMPEREPDGSTLWHGYIMDVSERKRSEARIYELAYFDPLTGLPNRTMLEERIRHAAAPGAQGRRHGALLFVDLDHFKMLNDTKGHHVGDLLLCEIAGPHPVLRARGRHRGAARRRRIRRAPECAQPRPEPGDAARAGDRRAHPVERRPAVPA